MKMCGALGIIGWRFRGDRGFGEVGKVGEFRAMADETWGLMRMIGGVERGCEKVWFGTRFTFGLDKLLWEKRKEKGMPV